MENGKQLWDCGAQLFAARMVEYPGPGHGRFHITSSATLNPTGHPIRNLIFVLSTLTQES